MNGPWRQDQKLSLIHIYDGNAPATPTEGDNDGNAPATPTEGDNDGNAPATPTEGDNDGNVLTTPAEDGGIANNGLNDIVLLTEEEEEATAEPITQWVPIGNATTAFRGTFDGQGHTISNIYMDGTVDYDYYGFFGALGYTGTVRNLTLQGEITGDTYVGGLIGYNVAPLGMVSNTTKATIEDVHVDMTLRGEDAATVGGLVGYLDFRLSVSQCTVDGSISTSGTDAYAGGFFGDTSGAERSNQSLTDSYITAKLSATDGATGGYFVGNGTRVSPTRCFYYNAESMGYFPIGSAPTTSSQTSFYLAEAEDDNSTNGAIRYMARTAASFADGTVLYSLTTGQAAADICWKQGTSYPVFLEEGEEATMLNRFDLSQAIASEKGLVTINPAAAGEYTVVDDGNKAYHVITKSGTELPLTVTLPAEGAIIQWLPEGVVQQKEDGSYYVPLSQDYDLSYYFVTTAVEGDTSWYDEETAEFTLTDEADLRGFASLVNAGNDFSGKTVLLGNSIALTSDIWTPIGNNGNRFAGTFDGQGHTISGVKMPLYFQYMGFFGYLNNATVKNLTVAGELSILGNNNGGIAAYANNSTLENLHNQVVMNDPPVGGNSVSSTGGVVGYASGSSITNCTNDVDLQVMKGSLGGLAGSAGNNITDCSNSGDISGGGSSVGGLLGSAQSSLVITDCFNSGNVTSAGSSVAGLIGSLSASYNSFPKLSRCYNTGNVTINGEDKTSGYVAGLFNRSTTYAITVDKCYNTGAVTNHVTGNITSIAGLINATAARSNTTITDCYSSGVLTPGTATNIGGLISTYGTSFTLTVTRGIYCNDNLTDITLQDAEYTTGITAEEFALGKGTWLLTGGDTGERVGGWQQGENNWPELTDAEVPYLWQIEIAAKDAHGTVTVSGATQKEGAATAAYVAEGATVTPTSTADQGYTLSLIQVTKADGSKVTVNTCLLYTSKH